MGFGNWLADRTGIHPTAVAHGVGGILDNKWTKLAAAAGLAATGVGAPLSAGIMAGMGAAGGALHEGGGLGDALGGAAKGAVQGYGASKLGPFARAGLGALNGGSSGAQPSAGPQFNAETGQYDQPSGDAGGIDWGGILGKATGLLGGGAGALGGLAKGAFTGGGLGGISPGVLALAGLQGANAAQLGAKANSYADNAMNTVNQSWQDRAGLRGAGIAGLSTPRPMQNLAGLTAIRQQNPVAARAGLPAAAMRA